MTAADQLVIKGFLETSFVDWDGKIVAVVFLPYCNFRCPFCHNAGLVNQPDKYETIPVARIFSFLKEHTDFLDGVCITGGEPVLHVNQGLVEFIEEIKKLPLLVKLDTNGTDPELIKRLLDRKLVDFIAMDVKAPLDERYYKLCGVETDLAKIKQSVALIIKSGIESEFRTTVVPNLLYLKDIEDLARGIKGAKKFVLQQFDPRNTLDPALAAYEPYPLEKLQEMADLAKRWVQNVQIRGK
ncbi:MAG: anaerobic ribonucleoside-triphosphate reductase activating protein [Candidatus Margulisiibacteriota bacterium]|jgi:pyruvate formate lyase activating enzyme